MTKSLINDRTYKAKNHSRAVDTDSQNRAGCMSLSLLPINAAYTSSMHVCNQSPLTLPKIHNQKLLTLHWLSSSGCGRERISRVFDYTGSQYIHTRQQCTKVNILRLAVGHLNVPINTKPRNQNQRLEPTGLAKPGITHASIGPGPGLACQRAAGWVLGLGWDRTDLLLRSKPGPLVGYPDKLLTLLLTCL